MTAKSVVYCIVVMNLGELNISNNSRPAFWCKLKKTFFAKFCTKMVTFLNVFSAFKHKNCWKWLFQPGFGVLTTQTLVEIYTTSPRPYHFNCSIGALFHYDETNTILLLVLGLKMEDYEDLLTDDPPIRSSSSSSSRPVSGLTSRKSSAKSLKQNSRPGTV